MNEPFKPVIPRVSDPSMMSPSFSEPTSNNIEQTKPKQEPVKTAATDENKEKNESFVKTTKKNIMSALYQKKIIVIIVVIVILIVFVAAFLYMRKSKDGPDGRTASITERFKGMSNAIPGGAVDSSAKPPPNNIKPPAQPQTRLPTADETIEGPVDDIKKTREEQRLKQDTMKQQDLPPKSSMPPNLPPENNEFDLHEYLKSNAEQPVQAPASPVVEDTDEAKLDSKLQNAMEAQIMELVDDEDDADTTNDIVSENITPASKPEVPRENCSQMTKEGRYCRNKAVTGGRCRIHIKK